MIISMTGFGSSEAASEAYTLKAEVKTLNSKYFDLFPKIPREFARWELEIKSTLEHILRRGKVSLTLDFVAHSDSLVPVYINEPLFRVFYSEYEKLADKQGADKEELFKLALHSPNVLVPRDDFSDVIEREAVLKVVEEAATKCQESRTREGGRLQEALHQSIMAIEEQLEMVRQMDPRRIANIRSRIDKSLAEWVDQAKVDGNRFEQELIYYIEKLDINEEIVRLSSHLEYFMETMNAPDSNGKKLGFISQEIGREVNTIGSKANDTDIQRAVVEMKEALEKIKEQVLNVI